MKQTTVMIQQLVVIARTCPSDCYELEDASPTMIISNRWAGRIIQSKKSEDFEFFFGVTLIEKTKPMWERPASSQSH